MRPANAEITLQIYARMPVLVDESKGEAGNPWGLQFARLFDMSNDSGLFRTARPLANNGLRRDGRDWVHADGSGRYVPLYEAKMIHHYDLGWACHEDDGEDTRDLAAAEKADPGFEAEPRYWVPAREVQLRLTPLPKALVDALREGNKEHILLYDRDRVGEYRTGGWCWRPGTGWAKRSDTPDCMRYGNSADHVCKGDIDGCMPTQRLAIVPTFEDRTAETSLCAWLVEAFWGMTFSTSSGRPIPRSSSSQV